jgi:kynurenine formamidase
MCLAETLHATLPAVPDHQTHTTQHRPVSRRALLATGLGAAAGAVAARPAAAATGAATGGATGVAVPAAAAKPRSRMRDLTWTFSVSFPVVLDAWAATRTPVSVIGPDSPFYLQRWTLVEHAATHLDAPGHFVAGGRLAPDLQLDELVVPAVVIDITRKVATDHDAEVTVADLVAFERRHGRIPERAVALMYSGWETRAGSVGAYRGTDAAGRYHFPGWDVEAVDWLLERRRISGVGVDTLSLDHGPSQTFETHMRLLGADRYGLENLRGVGTIPPRGAELFVGLIPLEEGSGGPCRVIAHW